MSKKNRRTIKKSPPDNDWREKYVVISGCPHCGGAVFYRDPWPETLLHLFQCLSCARLYKRVNGKYALWVESVKEKTQKPLQKLSSTSRKIR